MGRCHGNGGTQGDPFFLSRAESLSAKTSVQTKLACLFEVANTPGRIPSMEGLRGFAVLLVFWIHFYGLFGAALRQDSILFRISHFAAVLGHSGVDLFFVLSGYLIYGKVIRKRIPYGAFLHRRVQRIYPAFLTVLAVYLLLHFTWFPIASFPSGSGAVLYILQNVALLPGLFRIPPIFAVAWSLSYEAFFYCTIPLLVWVTGMRRWRPSRRCLFFVLWVGVYLGLNLAWPSWLISAIDLAPLGHPRMILFVAGMLVYEVHTARRIHLNRWSEAAAVALFALCLAGYGALHVNPWLATNLRTAPSEAVLLSIGLPPYVFHCFAHHGFLNRLFSMTPLRWLGNMSYSYYLLHGLALQGLHLVLQQVLAGAILPPTAFAGLACLGLAVTLVPSAVLFALVEKPFSLTSERS